MKTTSSQVNLAVAVVIIPVTLPKLPALSAKSGWSGGPLPLERNKIVASTKNRSTFFHARVAKELYGDAEGRVRVHRQARDDEYLAGLEVLAVELLKMPGLGSRPCGFVAVHLELGGDPVTALSRVRQLRGGEFVAGGGLDLLTDGLATAPGTVRTSTVSLVTYSAQLPAPPFGSGYTKWSDVEQHLYQLATATPATEVSPDPGSTPPPSTEMSRTWRAMVVRNGIAFLGQVPDDGGEPFFSNGSAELYVRSLYTDVLLLGLMQNVALDELAEALVEDGGPHVSRVETLRDLESRLNQFRMRLWWQHLTAHGAANDLVRAYQAQHHLAELLAQVIADLTDAARLQGIIEGERSARALDVISKVGLPAGAVIGLTPVWVDYGIVTALVSAGVAALAGLGMMTAFERKSSGTDGT